MTSQTKAELITFAAMLLLYLIVLKASRTIKEIHHGYYGLALIAFSFWIYSSIALIVIGALIFADDLVQHIVQAIQIRDGATMEQLWTSPLHKLWEWFYRKYILP